MIVSFDIKGRHYYIDAHVGQTVCMVEEKYYYTFEEVLDK